MGVNILDSLFGIKPKAEKGNNPSNSNYELKVLKSQHDTAKKLEHIISKSALVNSGQVQLLGLSEIKQNLGEKWSDLRDRILGSLSKIVNSHIGVNDVFFSRSDEEHIIVFSSTSEKASRVICAKILQELSKIYLGHVETQNISVMTAVGRVKGKLLFESAPLDDIFTPVTDGEGISAEAIPEEPFQKKKSKGPSFEVVFKPLWNSKQEVMSTYMVNAYRMGPFNIEKFSYDVLDDPTDSEAIIDLDYQVLVETIETMDDLFMNNFRAIFSIPVSYETVFNSDRLKIFLSKLHIIPKELYKYILFNLIDFPSGVPEMKLRLIVSSLENYSQGVVITKSDTPQNISYYKNCGIKCFWLKVPEKIQNPKVYWNEQAILLTKCKQNNIFMALEGINRPDDLILAREIGINFLSGDVIGPYSDIPGHMARVTWRDLISK